LKKRRKKRFHALRGGSVTTGRRACSQRVKVFWFFFSKKNRFASVFTRRDTFGCRRLLSEDLQAGFTWARLTVVNPFAIPRHALLTDQCLTGMQPRSKPVQLPQTTPVELPQESR
jgi:hypothetical protein